MELGIFVVEFDVQGLIFNVIYFIWIIDYSVIGILNWGLFQFCVEEQEFVFMIDEGGFNFCSGIFYDIGGLDGDYGNNENNVFIICLDQLYDCIFFIMNYYNLELGGFLIIDVIFFYDGDGIDSLFILQLGDGDFLNNDEGGGGVCFQV